MKLTRSMREICLSLLQNTPIMWCADSQHAAAMAGLIEYDGNNRQGWKLTTAGHAVGMEEKGKKMIRAAAAKSRRRAKDELMKSLGFTKVRGSVSGKVYWE